MYTTLNLLKQTRACKPGFGRMLAFFGTNVKLKHQRIPLHVIALVGGPTDAEWAVQNSLVIDPQEFNALFLRTLPHTWYTLLDGNSVLRNARDGIASAVRTLRVNQAKAGLAAPAVADMSNNDDAEIEQDEDEWADPAATDSAISNTKPVMHYGVNVKMPIALYAADKETLKIGFENPKFDVQKFRDASMRIACNLTDGAEILAFINKYKDSLQLFASDSHSFDSVLETDVFNSPKQYLQYMLQNIDSHPRSASDMNRNNEKYVFPTTTKDRTPGENLAFALMPTGTFDFMRTMKYKAPNGAKVQPLENGKVKVTVEVNDDAKMFDLLHYFNNRESRTDQDAADDDNGRQYDDFIQWVEPAPTPTPTLVSVPASNQVRAA